MPENSGLKTELPNRFGEYYTVIREIARGGMGIVYLAHDNKLKRKVAIKHLVISEADKISRSERDELVYQFKREAIAIAKLNHSRIVNVYDIGEENENSHYIVMELIKGMTLSEVLEKYKVIAPEIILSFTFQMCEVLDYIHQNGIIHRDIKPENIIYSGKGNVKLTDFGIAKFEEEFEADLMNEESGFIGSLAYMSPEQIVSPEKVDVRADIYSFAVTLYQLFTGKLPFFGEDAKEVIMKIFNQEPEPISSLIDDFPEYLDKLIMKCLSKSADDRPANITEFENELGNIIEFKSSNKSSDLRFLAGEEIVERIASMKNLPAGTKTTNKLPQNIIKLKNLDLIDQSVESKKGSIFGDYDPEKAEKELKWIDNLESLISNQSSENNEVSDFKKSLDLFKLEFTNQQTAALFESISFFDPNDLIRYLNPFNGEKNLKQIIEGIFKSNFIDLLAKFADNSLIDPKIKESMKIFEQSFQYNPDMDKFFNAFKSKRFRIIEIKELLNLIKSEKKSFSYLYIEKYSPDNLESLFYLAYELFEHQIIKIGREDNNTELQIDFSDMLIEFKMITRAQKNLAFEKSEQKDPKAIGLTLIELGYFNPSKLESLITLFNWYKKILSD